MGRGYGWLAEEDTREKKKEEKEGKKGGDLGELWRQEKGNKGDSREGGGHHLELGKRSFSKTLLHHLPIYTHCFVVCLG